MFATKVLLCLPGIVNDKKAVDHRQIPIKLALPLNFLLL